MDTIVVYSAEHSNRLKYVLDWLFKERLQLNYKLTHNEADTHGLPVFISYGKPVANSISIPDTKLLWAKGTEKLTPETDNWNSLPVLFAIKDSGCSIPFDLLSAIFFLLSRYEEYDQRSNDKHGRYPATHSILYKQGLLTRPILDEWVSAFRKQLQQAIGMNLPATHFVFQPTYDIDIAYSHIHKGFMRIMGAYVRAMLKGDMRQISERTQVLKNKQKDPYDSFRWLRQLHKQYDCKPIYFILSANKTTAFDKNIHPQHPAMMRVIKNLAKEGAIGIHPSYYAEDGDLLTKEKNMLEHIAGNTTHISRQHYIKVKLPDTYRMLLRHNIKEDYTMGYGSHLGFRAGTGNSFYWFDAEQDTVTPLRVHPFCFMDTTAHFEAKLSPTEAFAKLEAMSTILEKTGSPLITIFHNFSLGTSSEWKGWRQCYEAFMQEKTTRTHHEEHTH
jgi:hypothetical protein